jgi:tryptophanyl-tRNA synthetase
MSKSLGNAIFLADEPEEVQHKIMKIFTDPNHLKVSDPGTVEGNTMFTFLDAFCTDAHFAEYLPEYSCLDELKDHYRRGGLGDVKVKKFLNKILQAELAPIRQRRQRLEENKREVYQILLDGSLVAREVAAKTLERVRNAIGLNYFEILKS